MIKYVKRVRIYRIATNASPNFSKVKFQETHAINNLWKSLMAIYNSGEKYEC
jgi:hypothetical protein